jgi:hypothetical protein
VLDAGVVHEDVDRAERFGRPLDEGAASSGFDMSAWT